MHARSSRRWASVGLGLVAAATAMLAAGGTAVASTSTPTALSNPAPASNPASDQVAAAAVAGAAGTSHRPNIPAPAGRARPQTSGLHNSTSTNWSGYADYGTTFNYVYASWIVPRANCGFLGTGASSTWLGLDGYGNGTVEQLGTATSCLWGAAQYHAWYELYPAAEIALPSGYGVNPGDSMSAYVYYSPSANGYYFWMYDRTRGWSWSTFRSTPSPRPSNTTAEWITEQPSCTYQCSWLTNYGRADFSYAVAATPGGPALPITSYAYDAITMVAGSTVKSYPSALWNGGENFSTYFAHS